MLGRRRALWASSSRGQTSRRGALPAGEGAAPEASVRVCSVVALWGRMGSSSLGSSVHVILQARTG